VSPAEAARASIGAIGAPRTEETPVRTDAPTRGSMARMSERAQAIERAGVEDEASGAVGGATIEDVPGGGDAPSAAAPPPAEAAGAVVVKQVPTCPLCHEALTALPKLRVCPTCQTIHHEACLDEVGRCATLGCAGLGARTAGPAAELRSDAHARTLAILAHLLGYAVGGPVTPLLLWAWARHTGLPFVQRHALHALVFQLASFVALLATCGLWVLPMTYFTIRAAVRAHRGERNAYEHPRLPWSDGGDAADAATRAKAKDA
jgi:hypothetical protein